MRKHSKLHNIIILLDLLMVLNKSILANRSLCVHLFIESDFCMSCMALVVFVGVIFI